MDSGLKVPAICRRPRTSRRGNRLGHPSLATALILGAAPLCADTPPPAQPVKEIKSRMLTGEQLQPTLAALYEKLNITKRSSGPFGRPQVIRVASSRKQAPVVTEDMFRKAINAIKINAVIGAERKFIIGAREFRAGDSFPVVRGGARFNTKVLSVSSSRIIFQNKDTGKIVRRNMSTLPPGMRRQGTIRNIPGVTPGKNGNSAPLRVPSDDTLPPDN